MNENFCPWGIGYAKGSTLEKIVFHVLRLGQGPLRWFLHHALHRLGLIFGFNPGPADNIVALARVGCFVPWSEFKG